ncbi:hypothetical protein SEA_VANLEE_60 [Gordonia phage VanLee]|uniref:Uncharacterized protein n=1 Tax=Gordonia phage VanLee TaxID=2845816 RepID=A0A8F2DAD0_9CAUD|nr:hypothetical protein QEH49_gp060 [Gordonia phage VanLee]QWS68177.1 hypothetical protein SEA_VANLEE_60 [Gordonia phage VanLee]
MRRPSAISSIHVHADPGMTPSELVVLAGLVPDGTFASDCDCCDFVFRAKGAQ